MMIKILINFRENKLPDQVKTNNEWLQKNNIQVNAISSQSDLPIIQEQACNVEPIRTVQESVSSSVESIRANSDKTIPCLKSRTLKELVGLIMKLLY